MLRVTQMIIERLKLIQGQRTNQEFADRLGIHKLSWVRIKNRRVPVSDKFLVRVLRAFPEMKTVVDLYISTKDIDHIGNISRPYQKPQNKIWGALKALLGKMARAKEDTTIPR